jgi:hypothetical protein
MSSPATKIANSPRANVIVDFLNHCVEPAAGDIFFNLSVPGFPVELDKPFAKRSKLVTGKFTHCLLDLLDVHAVQDYRAAFSSAIPNRRSPRNLRLKIS